MKPQKPIDFHSLQDLLQKEVSRQEFLRLLLVALLSIVGITAMLASLNRFLTPAAREKPSGFGAGPYGG